MIFAYHIRLCTPGPPRSFWIYFFDKMVILNTEKPVFSSILGGDLVYFQIFGVKMAQKWSFYYCGSICTIAIRAAMLLEKWKQSKVNFAFSPFFADQKQSKAKSIFKIKIWKQSKARQSKAKQSRQSSPVLLLFIPMLLFQAHNIHSDF